MDTDAGSSSHLMATRAPTRAHSHLITALPMSRYAADGGGKADIAILRMWAQQQTSNPIGGPPSWDSNAANSREALGLPAPVHSSIFQNRVTIDNISMVVGASNADQAGPGLRDGPHTRAPNRSLAGAPQRAHKR
jgi:hypothetical protein